MIALLLVLTPIGLFDGLSPVTFGFLFAVQSGTRPLRNAALFTFGRFVSYFAAGIVILFGLQAIFIEINEYAVRFWPKPDTPDMIFQILIGAVLGFLGVRMLTGPNKPAQPEISGTLGPRRAITLGAISTVVALPFSIMYFAAIDQILKADLSTVPNVIALLFFNVVFVLPLIAFLAMTSWFGERGMATLSAVRQKVERWSPVAFGTLFAGGGVFLVVDGISWFLGRPILPA